MITKFILFENQGIGQRYWKVLIDDNLFVSLTKIGMPEEIQNDLYEHLIDIEIKPSSAKGYNYVTVGEDNYSENPDWHWNFNQDWIEGVFYADTPSEKYKYQGVVEVNQDEIDDWVLKNDAKKYNL